MKPSVTLYTTLGCHLCEDAAELLRSYSGTVQAVDIIEVEISDTDALIERYGIRIPVVAIPNTGIELGWPFNAEQLKKFLTNL